MPDFPTTCVNYVHDYSKILHGKVGIEIGGPSEAFLNTGIYTSPSILDNVVFSPNTILGVNAPNTPYAFKGKTNPGTTYIADVVDMRIIADERMDPGVKTMEQFVARSKNNHLNRALHVHIFDFELIEQCFHFFNYPLTDVQLVYPYHQIMVGMKPGDAML